MSVFVDIKHLQKENGFFVGFMKFETTSRDKGFSKLHASHYKLVVYFLRFFLGNPSRKYATNATYSICQLLLQ